MGTALVVDGGAGADVEVVAVIMMHVLVVNAVAPIVRTLRSL